MLKTYDHRLVPIVFAFKNSGVLCYINSLLQSLLSLPTFNLANKNNSILGDIIVRNHQQSNRETPRLENATPILRHLISKSSISANRQEDAHEGFQILIDAFCEHKEIFYIRYSTSIICNSCNHCHRVPGEEPPELWVDAHWNIDSQEKMQQYIRSQTETISDYKCEKCGGLGVSRRRSLRRLSEVIVVTFKNYPRFVGGKKIHYFPPEMSFPSVDGELKYSAVAKIDHMGDESGGHYVCVAKRRVHENAHRNYIAKLKKYIISNPGAADIDEYKQRLEHFRKNNETALFKLNDENISYYPDSEIRSTENTYMVFYHLMNVKKR